MANITNLEVWKRSISFSASIFKMCRSHSVISKDFGTKDQLQRASMSIASNIAEGADRSSDKQFLQFLSYARGSVVEVRTQLLILLEADILEQAIFDGLYAESIEIHKMINGLMKSVRNSKNT